MHNYLSCLGAPIAILGIIRSCEYVDKLRARDESTGFVCIGIVFTVWMTSLYHVLALNSHVIVYSDLVRRPAT